jgi:predicted TIM-barrel fold metal-dependent hydrolase
VLEVVDKEGAYRSGGTRGVWDADVRLSEMDREGIAAEFVYYGDHRAMTPFADSAGRRWQPELHQAGLRAYHRWAADVFGGHKDRIFLVGAPGEGADMGAMLAELEWISEHGFVGAYVPKFVPHDATPPLFDASWEPFWSMCEERRLPLFVHAGHGVAQGIIHAAAKAIDEQMKSSSDLAAINWVERFLSLVNSEGDFFADPRPRRALWQLMFGGVFDRHPNLKLVMTEVQADWLPATLRHLDETYLRVRGDVPAKRPPSEVWQTHCLTSLSFVHKAEVEMRHEIGLETISFGRDYPHEEGTWPNTEDWLRDAFAGVPEDELRLMLGENAVRFFGLDRSKLAEIAGRIGPTVEKISGDSPDLHPVLLAHMDGRGGYLKPAERGRRIPEIDAMLRADLAQAGVNA